MRRRRSLSVVVLLVAGASAGGCASLLDVRYPEAGATSALLSSTPSRRVAIGPVTDRRLDKTRIGATPGSGDAILTRRPVDEIVREALAVEVARNGHTVVGDAGDLVIAADVEEFWLDAARRRSTTQYVGRVAIALVVVDPQTGTRLLTRRYVGIKRRQAESDEDTARREVMDAALARTIHDVATDPVLVAALARR
jgi:hypothetical protein